MGVREKLLSAAAHVYAEAGYRGATTRRIAQEAGVNEITLFRHFGSKDALLLEALRHCGGVMAQAQLPENPADPERELGEWCRSHHARLYERRSLIRTCMGEMAEHPEMGYPTAAGPRAAARVLRDYFIRLRERGIARGDFEPDTAAWMLLAAIFADAMWRDVMSDGIAGGGAGPGRGDHRGAGETYWASAEDAMPECVRLVLRAIGVRVRVHRHPGGRSTAKPRRPHVRSA
jgi:AcrR family transcriptional regulator